MRCQIPSCHPHVAPGAPSPSSSPLPGPAEQTGTLESPSRPPAPSVASSGGAAALGVAAVAASPCHTHPRFPFCLLPAALICRGAPGQAECRQLPLQLPAPLGDGSFPPCSPAERLLLESPAPALCRARALPRVSPRFLTIPLAGGERVLQLAFVPLPGVQLGQLCLQGWVWALWERFLPWRQPRENSLEKPLPWPVPGFVAGTKQGRIEIKLGGLVEKWAQTLLCRPRRSLRKEQMK